MLCVVWTAAALLLSPALATQAAGPGPQVSLRADHMILDAAVDGARIFVATQSGRVEVFDWRRGVALEPLLALSAREGWEFAPSVRALALSPSGRRLAAASSDGALRILDLSNPDTDPPVLQRQTAGVLTCRFLGETRLLAGTLRGDLFLLDLETEKEIFRSHLEYDSVYTLALSPDGRKLAVGFASSRIRIVDPENGRILQRLEGHLDGVYGLAWAGNGELISGSKDKRVLAWNLGASPPSFRLLHGGDDFVMALAVNPAGDRVAMSLEETQVGILALPTGSLVRALDHHDAPVQVLRFVDGGSTLISAGSDAHILVWDLQRDVGGATP